MLAALLLALGTGLVAPPPEPHAPTVPCATCEGSGSALQDCWACDEGRRPCRACHPARRARPLRAVGDWIPGSLAARLAELREDRRAAPPARAPELPRGVKLASPKPGELRCPANCYGGRLLRQGEWLDCKLCRGGEFRCRLCDDGSFPCSRCGGSGRLYESCDDCAGTGRLPGGSALTPLVCPWCLGTQRRPCGTCDGGGSVTLPCEDCLGDVRVACPLCRGLEKHACPTCLGAGVPIRGDGKCTLCRGKGVMACRICDDGITTCLTCLGRAPEPRACPDCGGTKEHRCNGCFASGYRPWELRTRALLAAGQDERALAWRNEARVRCRMRFQSALDAMPPEVADDLGPRLEAERDAELARLDGLASGAGERR